MDYGGPNKRLVHTAHRLALALFIHAMNHATRRLPHHYGSFTAPGVAIDDFEQVSRRPAPARGGIVHHADPPPRIKSSLANSPGPMARLLSTKLKNGMRATERKMPTS
jgi:hypothetical protein